VAAVEDPLIRETFGTRYLFGNFIQRMLSSDIRLSWIFTPKLSLQLYLQPLLAVGEYQQFKELARPKSYDFNIYGEEGSTISCDEDGYTVDPDGPGPAAVFSFDSPDFNVKSLRGTMVLAGNIFQVPCFILFGLRTVRIIPIPAISISAAISGIC
jgi:hypothetical protein